MGYALCRALESQLVVKKSGDFADVFVKCVHSHFNDTYRQGDVMMGHYQKDSFKVSTRTRRTRSQYQPIPTLIQNRGMYTSTTALACFHWSHRQQSKPGTFPFRWDDSLITKQFVWFQCRSHRIINWFSASRTFQAEGLPPTKDALVQHIRRTHLQTATWFTAAEHQPECLQLEKIWMEIGK